VEFKIVSLDPADVFTEGGDLVQMRTANGCALADLRFTLAGLVLSPIEKVLALQKIPLFSRTSVDEMQQIAPVASIVTMTSGAALFAESAPPALWLILSGEVALTSAASPVPLQGRAGDIIGVLEMLSGHPLGLAAKVIEPGIALRINRDDLFDVLGERPELLRQMFAAMFRRTAGPSFASGVFRPKATQSAVIDPRQVGV
jgi:hypothetical protein